MADSPSELQMELEKLERKHAENPEGRYFVPLANAYRKLGNLEVAEQLLRQGLKHHPDYLSAHIVLGRALADRNATREAEAEFRYVLQLDPQNLIALRTLGEIAQTEGRRDEAEEWYRELLAVDPMNDDARRALEALEPAGGIVPPASFEEGVSWWERPLEEPRREPAAETPPLQAPADEPEPPAAAPDPDFQLGYAGEWLQLDDNSDADARDQRGGEDVEVSSNYDAGAEQDSWGEAARLSADDEPRDLDDAEGDDPEPGDADDEPELITETIAELYARQGFHDRAAQVYRELIRRRGGDPALQRRLEEVERLARGPSAPPPAAPQGTAPADVTAAAPDVPAPPMPPHTAAPDVAPAEPAAPLAVDAPQVPVAEVGPQQDVFAASLDDGFGVPAQQPSPGAGADWLRLLDDQPPAAPAPPTDAPASHPAADVAAEAAPAASAQPEAPGAQAPSIREFLARLASWAPGGDSAGAPLPELQAAPAAGDELELDSEPLPFSAWSPVEPPLPEPLPEPEPRDEAPLGTISAADDVLFPWEVGAREPEPTPPAPPEPELDEAHGVLESAAVDAPVTEAVEPEAEPQPDAAASSTAEDDDLESFQAWLRSLKR